MQPPLSTYSATGLLSALGAYLIWGMSPIYFKALAVVPPFQILMHRMIWSFALLLPLVGLLGRWRTFTRAVASGRTMMILLASTLLVSVNWFLFIWAINNDHILQASLGYYINPLVNVLLGMIFLGERLRRMQALAVVLAGAAVLYLTVSHGQFPWVALALAFSFGFYALIRKMAPVEALEGLTIETLLLFLPACAVLYYMDRTGTGAFLRIGAAIDLLLVGTAMVTAVPLLLFTIGARRLTLTTIGFLQYIAPSLTFLLAVFIYHEPFQAVQGWTFGLIWLALAIFSADALHQLRHRPTTGELATTSKPA